MGFPGGSVVKNPPANAGDIGSIPGPGRSPGGGNGHHSSTLAWRIPWSLARSLTIVHGVTKSWKQLSE